MIQQIQSVEDDDDEVIDSENGGESGLDINDGTSNADDQTPVDTQRMSVESMVDWHVVSIKPEGVKTFDRDQYAE